MKARLVALSLFSFFLLMYFAYLELALPYVIIPFLGFASSVLLWPESKINKKRNKVGRQNNDDAFDLAGYSIKAIFKSNKENKNDGKYLDNDIDI